MICHIDSCNLQVLRYEVVAICNIFYYFYTMDIFGDKWTMLIMRDLLEQGIYLTNVKLIHYIYFC